MRKCLFFDVHFLNIKSVQYKMLFMSFQNIIFKIKHTSAYFNTLTFCFLFLTEKNLTCFCFISGTLSRITEHN